MNACPAFGTKSTYPSTLQSIVDVLTSVLQIGNLPRDCRQVLLEGRKEAFEGVKQGDTCLYSCTGRKCDMMQRNT